MSLVLNFEEDDVRLNSITILLVGEAAGSYCLLSFVISLSY
jgi:hypothetical protein